MTKKNLQSIAHINWDTTRIWTGDIELVIRKIAENKYAVYELVEDVESVRMEDSWIETKVYDGDYIQCRLYLENRWVDYCRTLHNM